MLLPQGSSTWLSQLWPHMGVVLVWADSQFICERGPGTLDSPVKQPSSQLSEIKTKGALQIRQTRQSILLEGPHVLPLGGLQKPEVEARRMGEEKSLQDQTSQPDVSHIRTCQLQRGWRSAPMIAADRWTLWLRLPASYSSSLANQLLMCWAHRHLGSKALLCFCLQLVCD